MQCSSRYDENKLVHSLLLTRATPLRPAAQSMLCSWQQRRSTRSPRCTSPRKARHHPVQPATRVRCSRGSSSGRRLGSDGTLGRMPSCLRCSFQQYCSISRPLLEAAGTVQQRPETACRASISGICYQPSSIQRHRSKCSPADGCQDAGGYQTMQGNVISMGGKFDSIRLHEKGFCVDITGNPQQIQQ